MPKNTENAGFFEFQKIIKWPGLAEIGRQAYQNFRLARNSYQNFFVGSEPKIHEIIQNMIFLLNVVLRRNHF